MLNFWDGLNDPEDNQETSELKILDQSLFKIFRFLFICVFVFILEFAIAIMLILSLVVIYFRARKERIVEKVKFTSKGNIYCQHV